MIGENEFDRLLSSWLESEGPQDVPARLVDDALASARRQGQLGGRLDGLLGRYWPADPTGIWSPGGRRSVTIAVVALLTVALVGVSILAGAAILDRIRAVPAPTGLPAPSALPAPTATPAPTQAAVRSGPARFSTTGAMVAGREYPTMTKLVDGRVLILGGGAEPEIYDPTTGAFSRAGTLPSHEDGFSATLLDDGRVLIAGGNDPSKPRTFGPSFRRGVTTATLYDPASGTFVPTGSMNAGRTSHAAIKLKDGRVLVVDGGGLSELYDPRKGTWSELPDASASGSSDSMILLTDGRVLQLRSDGAALFDPATLSWAPAGPPATPRNQFWTLTALPDGGALLAGGTANDGTALTVAERFDPSTNRFRPTGSMTFARGQPTAFALADGRVVVMGFSADGITTAEIYDPRTEHFTVVDQPGAPDIATGVLLDDGRVLVAGLGQAQAQLFDPGAADVRPPAGAGTFNPIGGPSTRRLDPTMTRLRDDTVLIAGGRDENGEPLDTAERFDPATGSYTAVGDMTSPRVGHTATLSWQDQVLVAGGDDGKGPTRSADLFDPTGNIFTPTARMAAPRVGASAIFYSQGIDYIAGGSVGDTPEETATVDLYGGDSVFTPAPMLTSPRSGMAITELRDLSLLITGGSSRGKVVATAEIYRPDDGSGTASGATLISPMSVARVEHAAVGLGDGRVLITGGRTADGSVTASAEIFDPRTASFTTIRPMGTARRSHTATLMLDDRVLISGGFDADGHALASTEIFDPSSGQFASSPSMGIGRAGHGAWLLHDGRVLILGGVRGGPNGEPPGPMTAEVFDPSPDR